jgi:hypothetical protein
MKKSLNFVVVSSLIIFLTLGCTNANNSINKAKVKTVYESLNGCLKRCDELFLQEMKTYRECSKPYINLLVRQLGACRNLPADAREKCESEAEKNFDTGTSRCEEQLTKALEDYFACKKNCMDRFPSEMGF